jgi:LytS/YehU family sensor histidine kinase
MSKVLVIDDDRMVIEQISELVTGFGHKVSFVPKPKFAIQRMEKEEFDLILLDINMPDINGIDLLKEIKRNPEWVNIPVIMITGEGDNNTLIECFEYGASDYVEKPIIPTILRARINGLIRSHELARSELRLKEQEALQYKLRSLISQMNPHFIFNVLNSIQFHVLEENKEIAIESISKFSDLVRTSLNNSDKEFICLQSEIEFLTTYLNLEMDRFKGKLFFDIAIADEIDPEDIMVPPMLLQPYIENAIVHGIGNKEGKGNIKINFTTSDNCLQCEIVDDGIGREQARELKQLKVGSHESKGMSLTEVRMEMLNSKIGKGFNTTMLDLVLPDGEPNGTKVIVTMPLISQWDV